jgi:2-amino-4-hydroxy-6-hydroxymethyldihydropteridine diphosphokinase
MDDVRLLARSSVYETEPVGEIADQRDFLNAALSLDTELDPLELLAGCKSIELELGRTAGPRHGPRAIDVDLLLLGDVVLDSDRLRLPHPELCSRRFVLVPVIELEPALRLPDGTSLQECLTSLPPGQRVRRVASLEPMPG